MFVLRENRGTPDERISSVVVKPLGKSSTVKFEITMPSALTVATFPKLTVGMQPAGNSFSLQRAFRYDGTGVPDNSLATSTFTVPQAAGQPYTIDIKSTMPGYDYVFYVKPPSPMTFTVKGTKDGVVVLNTTVTLQPTSNFDGHVVWFLAAEP